MRRIHDRVAGCDVHRDSVSVCTERVEGKEVLRETARFSTTCRGVRELGDWLVELGVSRVVMESSGVYWKPVLYGLEDRMEEVLLVNAQHVKNLPGRKTDMSDAAWLADLAAHGMVRGSFVPPPEIRALRELTRYRKQLVRARVSEIQRLEKVFQDAGIKFTSVASGVWLKSSEAMIDALISGESDPVALAGLAKGTLRSDALRERLVEAMENRWREQHSTQAAVLCGHIRHIDTQIAALSATIAQRLVPWAAEIELLVTAPGVARTVAEVFIAETGGDMGVFETPDRLASWAGLAPGNAESAGKRHPVRARFGNQTIKSIMIEAAQAAVRHNGFLAARHRRIARRRGPNKATVAVARSLIIGMWHILNDREPWKDLGADHYTKHRDPQREISRHIAELQRLGFDVQLTPTS
jgi:transposase